MDDNTDIEINLNDDDLDVEINREQIIYTDVSEERLQEIEGDIDNLEEVVGIDVDTFSSSSTYAVGDTVVYNKKIYKCTTAITVAGAWDSSKWTEISVKELIDDTNEKIDDVEEEIDDFKDEQIQQNTLTAGLVPTNKANGESIDINDSGNYYFKEVVPEGQTEQESTIGKNILNINATREDSVKLSSVSIVGSKITLVKDTSSTAAGARYVLPITFESNTDYIITGKAKILNNTATGPCYVAVRKGSTSGQTIASGNLDISSTEEQNISTTFNSGDNTTMYFWFYVDSTNTAEEATLTRTVEYTDLMIRKANIPDDTYEPYTGGIPRTKSILSISY